MNKLPTIIELQSRHPNQVCDIYKVKLGEFTVEEFVQRYSQFKNANVTYAVLANTVPTCIPFILKHINPIQLLIAGYDRDYLGCGNDKKIMLYALDIVLLSDIDGQLLKDDDIVDKIVSRYSYELAFKVLKDMPDILRYRFLKSKIDKSHDNEKLCDFTLESYLNSVSYNVVAEFCIFAKKVWINDRDEFMRVHLNYMRYMNVVNDVKAYYEDRDMLITVTLDIENREHELKLLNEARDKLRNKCREFRK